MLSLAHSRTAGILLSFWSVATNGDDDYERLLGAWARADDDARDIGKQGREPCSMDGGAPARRRGDRCQRG